MNIKVKIALIIIITLIIGVVMGAMLNRALVRYKIQKTFAVRQPGRFVYFMERIIQPEQEQRDQIRAILKKHAGRTEEMRGRFFSEMQAEKESLLKDLDPILTPKQMKRLKQGPPGFPPDHRPWPERRPFREPPWKKPPPEEEYH